MKYSFLTIISVVLAVSSLSVVEFEVIPKLIDMYLKFSYTYKAYRYSSFHAYMQRVISKLQTLSIFAAVACFCHVCPLLFAIMIKGMFSSQLNFQRL